MRLLNALVLFVSLTLLAAFGGRALLAAPDTTSTSDIPPSVAAYQQRFLADYEPPHDLERMGLTPCVGGFAGPYPCENVDLLAFLPLAAIGGGSGNDSWGWTDPLDGKEYAIMGRSSGTSFVDISDPLSPIYLGNLPPHGSNSTWRDIKVYANYAFIVSEASGHGMQIFDLTQLRDVDNPPVTFSETDHYNGFGNAHNLVINEDTGFAYAVGTSTCSGGLHMVNIQDPLNPTNAGCFSSDGYTHDAQCVIYNGPDVAHQGKEVCFNANEDSVTIVDVTNKATPVQLSRTEYSGSAYTHQGWLTEDHRYFLQDDELDESNFGHNTRTRVWDVQDLDDPEMIGFYDGPTPAIDHNLYIVGNIAYEANYRAGLRILDITDVANANLTQIGYFDTYPSSNSADFSSAWSNYPFFESGNVIISTMTEGLFIVRPNLPGGLEISKSQPEGELNYGETITYTISVTNTGNITATDVAVTDIFNGVSYPVDGPTEIAPGDTATYLFTWEVSAADCLLNAFTNLAEVTSTNTQGDELDAPITTATTCDAPTLSISKSQPAGDLMPGNTITYTIWLTNTSPLTATELVVTDTLNGNDVILTGATTLGPAESTTYQFTYDLTKADCHTDLVNTVTATSSQGSFAELLTPVTTTVHCQTETTYTLYLPAAIYNNEE